VIGVPHPKWGEGPLLITETHDRAQANKEAILHALQREFVTWQLPDRSFSRQGADRNWKDRQETSAGQLFRPLQRLTRTGMGRDPATLLQNHTANI